MGKDSGALPGSRADASSPQAVSTKGFDPARRMLALVPKAQTPCWPWELRETGEGHPIGAICGACGRDVALERSLKGHAALCLYCALDSGLLPAIEIEPDDERTLHAIAMAPRSGGKRRFAGPSGLPSAGRRHRPTTVTVAQGEEEI